MNADDTEHRIKTKLLLFSKARLLPGSAAFCVYFFYGFIIVIGAFLDCLSGDGIFHLWIYTTLKSYTTLCWSTVIPHLWFLTSVLTEVMFSSLLVHAISNFPFNLSFHRLVLVSGRRNSRRISPMPDSSDNANP